ncbi:hypothetical protein AOC36_04185 [Erysipelothrix larvae]|uniref:GyrI-like small molecule binding domain-containing protein n=1 Tax=Erysipelothrix larvae TaxID=1514105 RepID=A0A120JTL0_9FIRM|nr:hypothetical protein [Erysipelothrix larvae]AMC93198.1 hypothetical protein AOC36_04185 [Erysipelothrix larvae]
MNYKIEKLEIDPLVAASTRVSIPDYSKDVANRALYALKKELNRKGIDVSEEEYSFLVQYDSDERLEVVDVEIFTRVKDKGDDTESVKFIELPKQEAILRVTTNNFEDIHIALAEWMHDHDYVADGGLRMVVHDGSEYICDCPVKPADD